MKFKSNELTKPIDVGPERLDRTCTRWVFLFLAACVPTDCDISRIMENVMELHKDV